MALDDAVERTKEEKRIRRDDDDDDNDEDDIDDELSYSSWRTPRRIGNSIDFPLTSIRAHLLCKLCHGYYRDPCTVADCLHTFCRSCLIMFFRQGMHSCPTCAIRLGPDPLHTSIMQQFEEESETGANSFQVPTEVPTLRPREWFAAHGSFSKCSSSISLMEDLDTHLVSVDTRSAQRAQSLPGHESQARCDGLIIQQFEEATTSGNNLVPPEVNLVEEAIEFASNINPENLPIRSYDANGALIDVQWQGEVNALETLHDDPTFRNVVSQQDSILHSVLTPSISKLSTSSFKNLGIISVPTNASAANEEVAVLPREWFAAHGKSTGNSSNFNMSIMNESLMSFSTFLSIEPSDANGALIDVQWQGEVNGLETFPNDSTFRNVVSQQVIEPSENDILFVRM